MDRNEQLHELRSDEAFAELLGKASRRASPPEIVEAQIRHAIHAEWQCVVNRRNRRSHLMSFAIAASILLAVFATLNMLRAPLPDFTSQQLATIDKKFGDVAIATQGQAVSREFASIEGSDIVETGAHSGLALSWHDGGSLRLDENTAVVFEAADQVYLQRGRLYFDSIDILSPRSPGEAVDFTVRTDAGVVKHLGTQYMAEVTADGMTVSVREGRVSVAGGQDNMRANAGEQMAITGSGSFTVTNIASFDEQWQWIEKTTPAIDVDGRPVFQALQWVGRESGLQLVFTSDAAETLAASTELRGLQGQLDVPPSRALEIFMLTVDLDARIDDGRIVVSQVP